MSNKSLKGRFVATNQMAVVVMIIMSINTNANNDNQPTQLRGKGVQFAKGNQAAALSNADKRTIQLQREARKMARAPIVERFKYALGTAIPRLLEIIRDPKTSPKDVIAAIALLSEYCIGKPTTKSEVVQSVTMTQIDPAKLTPEEITQMLMLDNKLQGK